MSASSKPTMQTIADAAGVSRATVSLALRNDPRLPPATRQRIGEVARQLGYQTNPLVATLMAGLRSTKPGARRATIALVNTLSQPANKRMPLSYQRTLNGIRERATQLGYGLEEIWMGEPGMNQARLTTILQARGIRGVLLFTPTQDTVQDLSEMGWADFAVANIYYDVHAPGFNRAAHHFAQGMRLALEHVTRLGYHRVGLPLTRTLDPGVDYGWSSAFFVFQHQIPTADRVPLLPLKRRVNWREGFYSWFEHYHPDVIITHELVVLEWLASRRIRVPQEVGFVNLDCAPGDKLAGINQNNEMVGISAVDIIVGQLHRNEYGIPTVPKLVLVPGQWLDGTTLRAAALVSHGVAKPRN